MGDGYTTPCHPGPPAYPHCPVPLPGLRREGHRGSTKRKFLYAALTPEQLRAVELSPEEHRVILGPSGSGKTQILLHRARYLCDTFHLAEDRFHIFVLTNLLKEYLGSALQLLDLPAHCVTTLDRWCAEFYQGHIARTLPWDWEKAWEWEKVPDVAAIRRAVLNKLREPVWNFPVLHAARDKIRGNSPKQSLFDFVFVDEGQDLDEEAFELLKTVSKHVTVCTVSQSPVSYNPIAYYATFGDEHGQARRDAQGAWWFTGDDGAVTLLHPEERASLHLHGNQQMYGQGSNERQL